MKLDVIVPTYNRESLLRRTVRSLLAAPVPRGLEARVTVVDNNSKDGTRRAVEEWREESGGRLSYLFEGRQGKSYALNSAIAATDGDLVGFVDDDEEVDAGWFEAVARGFAEPGVDFVGGPYLPRWGAEPPAWLPEDYRGVIGWVEAGERVLPYDENFPGIMMGGNAVIRRGALERVGPYTTAAMRTGDSPFCGEDEDMYRRLLAAGARGFYRPDLRIYHYIPPERLTKRYHRRWCFWRGVGSGVLDRARPQPVAYLGGVPRYLYGRAARGLAHALGGRLKPGGSPARAFSHELALWDWAGFFYGKHFHARGRRRDEHAAAAPPAARVGRNAQS